MMEYHEGPDRCIFKVKQVKVFHLDPGVREKRSQTPPSTLGRILAFRNCAIKCELNVFKKLFYQSQRHER